MVIVLISASGCSQLELIYRNANSLIEWQVSKYLNQSAEDERVLQQVTNNFMQWHSNEMLPLYITHLEDIASALKTEFLDQNYVLDVINKTTGLFEKTLIGSAPFIAKILKRHTSDEKLRYFAERLNETLLEKQKDIHNARRSIDQRPHTHAYSYTYFYTASTCTVGYKIFF